MTIFNYQIYKTDLIKEAMGATRMEFREPYLWWDYQELINNPPDDWKNAVETVPSLDSVLSDVSKRRESAVESVSKDNNITRGKADQMIKTYIGFHPAYGAYACQLGPYTSKGFIWGKPHIVGEAKENRRFGYYVIRYTKATEGEIAKALTSNISNYQEAFNVQLSPSDFDLHIRSPKKEQPKTAKGLERKNVAYEDVVAPINMDPNNPQLRNLFNADAPDPEHQGHGPMMPEGNFVGLNVDGQAKVLQSLNQQGVDNFLRRVLSQYYDEVLQEIAVKSRKTTQQIVASMSTNLNLVGRVYTAAYKKYAAEKKAEKSGGPAVRFQLPSPPPPKFLDGSLQLKPGVGSIQYRKIPTSELQTQEFELTKEVLQYMIQGITDPQQIADRLNATPFRVAFNERRMAQNKARVAAGKYELPLGKFTADVVQMHIDIIESQKEKLGENATYEQVSPEIQKVQDQTMNVIVDEGGNEIKNERYGYDDLKTAFQMASLFFSSVGRDKMTGAQYGVPNAERFQRIHENFTNFTSSDLKDAAAGRKLTEKERESSEELEAEIGALPDVGKALVEPAVEVEPLAEGEDPFAEIQEKAPEVQPVPTKDPQVVNQEEAKKKPEANLEDIIGTTLKNLIKIAAELDGEGKEDASEEIHNIIRKYHKRIF